MHASKRGECDSTLAQTLDEFSKLDRYVCSYWEGVWRISEEGAVRDAVLHPLHVLKHFEVISYLKLLCERGCKVDFHDSAKRKPLSYASQRGNMSSVKQAASEPRRFSERAKFPWNSTNSLCMQCQVPS